MKFERAEGQHSRPAKSAVERANQDIAEGNHWLARQRLESHLLAVGYDPELLVKLGEIASAMHDAFNAGRFWLTSTAEGAHVEEAVAVFIEHVGSDAKQIAASLPRAVRLPDLASYPPIVQTRLRRLGLDAAVIASSPSTPAAKERLSWSVRALVLVAAIGILFSFITLCIGAWTIVDWLWG